MSVFKFPDAVRVVSKAAKRPSCRHTNCQLRSDRRLMVATARMRSARPSGEQITHQTFFFPS